MKKTITIIPLLLAFALSTFATSACARDSKPISLEAFVSWSMSTELAKLSPEQLQQALINYKIEATQTYADKRYRFFRGYPEFIDGVSKYRFQLSGDGKNRWELLDAHFYFPALSQQDITQLNALLSGLGKPAKSSQNDAITKTRWMLDEFIEISLRVDREAGNVDINYSVLQGETPF